MQSPEKLVLTRLNYEWENIVNLIKLHNFKTWKLTYDKITELLAEKLGDDEVSISSEYMVFDNCYKQTGDISFLTLYSTLIRNYRNVFKITSGMPIKGIRFEFKKHKKRNVLQRHINIINALLDDELELNINDIILIEDYMDDDPELYTEILRYMEALYLFEIEYNIPDLDLDSESEFDSDEVPELAVKQCLLL